MGFTLLGTGIGSVSFVLGFRLILSLLGVKRESRVICLLLEGLGLRPRALNWFCCCFAIALNLCFALIFHTRLGACSRVLLLAVFT